MWNAFASGVIFVNIVLQKEKAAHRNESIDNERGEKYKQANILTIRSDKQINRQKDQTECWTRS